MAETFYETNSNGWFQKNQIIKYKYKKISRNINIIIIKFYLNGIRSYN